MLTHKLNIPYIKKLKDQVKLGGKFAKTVIDAKKIIEEKDLAILGFDAKLESLNKSLNNSLDTNLSLLTEIHKLKEINEDNNKTIASFECVVSEYQKKLSHKIDEYEILFDKVYDYRSYSALLQKQINKFKDDYTKTGTINFSEIF